MANDPYKTGMFQENPYYAKSDLTGRLAVVLQGRYETRGLQLITQPSRCICKNQVHELIASDEAGIKPGSTVDRIAYVGFVEIEQGGVIISGDEVLYNDTPIGRIAGFDETHMPNHYNIVLKVAERRTGVELNLEPGGRITIRQVKG